MAPTMAATAYAKQNKSSFQLTRNTKYFKPIKADPTRLVDSLESAHLIDYEFKRIANTDVPDLGRIYSKGSAAGLSTDWH